MKTIEERAKEYAPDAFDPDYILPAREGHIVNKERSAYIAGATEQKAIDIEKACSIFCHVGCPHKTDSYDCLKDKCDAWKRFRRMMEEQI